MDKDKARRLLDIDDNKIIDSRVIDPYIAAASAKIDSLLGAYYVIPITGPQSLAICKGICIGMVMGFIYLPNTDGNLPQRIQDEISRANEMLDQYGKWQATGKTDIIFAPVQFLPDAPTHQKPVTRTTNKAMDYSRGL